MSELTADEVAILAFYRFSWYFFVSYIVLNR